MDEGKVKEALEGKLSLDELNNEELSAFRKEAKELAEKERGEVAGLREAKRAENERIEKLREEAQKIESARQSQEDILNKGKEEVTQFRQEQIEKAKANFFKQFPEAEKQKEQIEATFSRLDSGKIDSDFILKDFVSAYAATDPDSYLAARERAKNLEKGAADFNAGSAGSHSANPEGGSEGEKYSEAAKKLAKEANISEDSAQKIQEQGMSRRYE